MEPKGHWEKVYSTKSTTEVSWFQEHAKTSLKIMREANVSKSASIIDVGGGASTFVDDLLSDGYDDITVLDLSGAAMTAAKSRLGERASQPKWMQANILEVQFQKYSYDVWHDRAVFHFLTSENERRAYVGKVLQAVKPGGFVVVATFAEDGPTKCSGLPVMRYNASELHAEFGELFQLIGHEKESHHTPGGNEQKFVYCFCRTLDPYAGRLSSELTLRNH